ncbi:MAG: PQQ-dependent sugar dehydrogenase [Bacteroidetes bacterium]|nr:PQQ-dependent sugar dehydrogenase [Bacteroidota bacterium]
MAPFVSKSQAVPLVTTEVIDSLTTPWEIIWGPDNWIWFTEKLNGQISRVNPANGNRVVLRKIPQVTTAVQESGLLGMALHPSFSATPHVFVAYNYNSGTPYLKVERYTYDPILDTLINPFKIVDSIPTGGNHHGCRLLIVGDKLFMTTGDAGTGSTAQNDNSLNGKTLRVNLDGTIPSDNPIAGNRLWSKGHRNAQGLIYVSSYNRIYTSEHGGADELNIIEKGRNYAWPLGSGVCVTATCQANLVRQPLVPNLANFNPVFGAPSGIDYYNHPAIPQWQNSILVGELSSTDLVAVKLNTAGDSALSAQVHYSGTFGRIRDICVSPDGRVFISTSNKDQLVGSPSNTDDKIIEIKNPLFTSITENVQKYSGRIYPNPVSSMLTVELNASDLKDASFLLYNAVGEKVMFNKLEFVNNQINTSVLSKGIYYYSVSNLEATLFNGKLIVE